jgi:hypothetical protein
VTSPAGTRAEVRGAIEAFFNARIGQGGTIPAIGQVFGFPEKIMTESDMFQDFEPGMNEGAFLFIHLMHSSETRIALGGPTSGQKWIDYECTLTTVFRSMAQKSSDAGIANESMIDAIVAAIRSDREAGAAGTIFQWGEGTRTGGVDIEVESFYPQSLHASQGATQILTTFKVKVAQVIYA